MRKAEVYENHVLAGTLDKRMVSLTFLPCKDLFDGKKRKNYKERLNVSIR